MGMQFVLVKDTSKRQWGSNSRLFSPMSDAQATRPSRCEIRTPDYYFQSQTHKPPGHRAMGFELPTIISRVRCTSHQVIALWDSNSRLLFPESDAQATRPSRCGIRTPDYSLPCPTHKPPNHCIASWNTLTMALSSFL